MEVIPTRKRYIENETKEVVSFTLGKNKLTKQEREDILITFFTAAQSQALTLRHLKPL